MGFQCRVGLESVDDGDGACGSQRPRFDPLGRALILEEEGMNHHHSNRPMLRPKAYANRTQAPYPQMMGAHTWSTCVVTCLSNHEQLLPSKCNICKVQGHAPTNTKARRSRFPINKRGIWEPSSPPKS